MSHQNSYITPILLPNINLLLLLVRPVLLLPFLPHPHGLLRQPLLKPLLLIFLPISHLKHSCHPADALPAPHGRRGRRRFFRRRRRLPTLSPLRWGWGSQGRPLRIHVRLPFLPLLAVLVLLLPKVGAVKARECVAAVRASGGGLL
jgi:hypothetical protein